MTKPSKGKYIVISAADDAHIPMVEPHLDQPFLVLDPASIIKGEQLSYSLKGGEIEVRHEGRLLHDVRGVWYRKPELPAAALMPFAQSFKKYSYESILSFAHLIKTRFPQATWVSDYYAIRRAEDKILQLEVAAQIGFRVPATIVTSSPEDARQFVAKLPGTHVVIKPIQSADIKMADGGTKLIVARKVAKEAVRYDGLHLAPSFFQQPVEQGVDIRVAVVGTQVFAATLQTKRPPSNQGDTCDWATNMLVDGFVIEPHQLPPDIEQLCIDHVRKLGLRFGALDLIRDAQGVYWFIENNPNGQWGFVEHVTGQPIGKAMAELLMGAQ
jgi:glutathione synthase/RimK-type ligase-like ATP-grasp enzyme